ncbi:MAG: prepilin-type N-terminal cleavage/methylation domain-containing protein [Pseudomonadales bacterium]|nr:prepilin-type N-terminal cleavage/methylation domain-containing protein [Pseudomonadales bacterium]
MSVFKFKQSGLTLIELLISLLLTGLVLAVLMQMYVMNLRNNALAQSVGETQEYSRLAIDLLSKSLRMAGYMGWIQPKSPR